ncbi:hypothetical protein AJ79_01031 [Helicocarpus griseus UAMH5409]|uniref:Killer toxin Kp4 domain-containing protein n=1 Tax=Helicocarpus griseus UAMH5409 TaxID=1447875 RepID=A0A2B7Y9A3_9EURO|nr:hypothetical protein AJ79_01031 [Helicocarpus griseus UAMH5409]
MRYTATFAISIAALASKRAEATPDTLKLPLFNGAEVVAATVEGSVKAHAAAGESFSCAGSTLCGSSLSAGECDAAYRIIDANHRYFTGSGATQTGVCYGNCGIFVEGGNCDLSGREMIDGYNQLRDHGCRICGSKTYDDGCRLTVNYVTGC